MGEAVRDAERAKILNRIKALLSRDASKGASEAEAATALSLARKLMDQYGLDMAEVEAHGPAEDWTTATVWEGEGIRTATDGDFIGPILDRFFRVKVFTERKGPPEFGVSVRIFGDRPDVDVARWVWVYLSGLAEDLWIAYRARYRVRKDKRRAYMMGLVSGLYRRLLAEEIASRPPAKPSGKNEIVPTRSRVDEAFEAAFGAIPSRSVGRFRDSSTLAAGMSDGRQVNLSRPVAETEARGLPGPKRALPS